ncbi:hypothetical protein [Dyadobacter crusticola]|uniref:hypothetical protein n=1 Tax=Dyadobacter crusticola TaxID=292407 RepID=UPI0004E252FF|nr:hypothetical protein [Dyadobacter crusticola]
MINVDPPLYILLLAMQLFTKPIEKESSLSNREIAIEIYLLESDKIRYSDNSMAFYPDESDLPLLPLITNEEIVSYRKKVPSSQDDTVYLLRLNKTGIEKIRKLTNVQISRGRPFAICINRKPVFGGYFWQSFSSYSCDWIVIPLDFASGELSILNGYPSTKFSRVDEDLRKSSVLSEAFEDRSRSNK